jgi:hypothetical protein
MIIRVIHFIGGAVFGAGGAIFLFYFEEHSPVHWGIVGLAAAVMGVLAASFGQRFWDTATKHWP